MRSVTQVAWCAGVQSSGPVCITCLVLRAESHLAVQGEIGRQGVGASLPRCRSLTCRSRQVPTVAPRLLHRSLGCAAIACPLQNLCTCGYTQGRHTTHTPLAEKPSWIRTVHFLKILRVTRAVYCPVRVRSGSRLTVAGGGPGRSCLGRGI